MPARLAKIARAVVLHQQPTTSSAPLRLEMSEPYSRIHMILNPYRKAHELIVRGSSEHIWHHRFVTATLSRRTARLDYGRVPSKRFQLPFH